MPGGHADPVPDGRARRRTRGLRSWRWSAILAAIGLRRVPARRWARPSVGWSSRASRCSGRCSAGRASPSSATSLACSSRPRCRCPRPSSWRAGAWATPSWPRPARRSGTSVEQGRTLSDALVALAPMPGGLRELLAGSEGRGDLAPVAPPGRRHVRGPGPVPGGVRSTTFFAALTLLFILWGVGFVVTALYLPLIST